MPEPTIFQEQDYGRIKLRAAHSPADLEQVAALRKVRFRNNKSADMDRFDALCTHLLVSENGSDEALACARIRLLHGAALDSGYSGQHYDLSPLIEADLHALELGRICIAQDRRQDPDIFRALLSGIARFAVAARADVLIGCASFSGNDPARHEAALGWLMARHAGPAALCPRKRDALAFDLPRISEGKDQKAAVQSIPPLLRMYLGMGGWVSDHGVRDPNLNTLHVFTAVEIARIPPARKRLLMGMTQPR